MSMTDPIADLLTRIRNACIAKHDQLDVPASNLRKAICEVLVREGYLESMEVIEGAPHDILRLQLRYSPEGQQVIRHLERISKPGLRVFRKSSDLPKVLGGHGMAIVTTSQGVLTDAEARERSVGGEVLCEVW